jgi:hypothetical protein
MLICHQPSSTAVESWAVIGRWYCLNFLLSSNLFHMSAAGILVHSSWHYFWGHWLVYIYVNVPQDAKDIMRLLCKLYWSGTLKIAKLPLCTQMKLKDIEGMVPDNKSHPCNFITCNACKEYSSIKAPVHILTINTSNFICNWVKDLNFQCSGMFCSNGFNTKQIWYQIFGCFACFLYHLCLVATWPYTNPILQNNPKSITFWSALQKLTGIHGLPKQRSEEAHSWGAACNCVGFDLLCLSIEPAHMHLHGHPSFNNSFKKRNKLFLTS